MFRPSRTRIVLLISLLVLVLPASVLATDTKTARWPAYYDDQVVTVLMGPSGNSQNPNQLTSACFLDLGPDFGQHKDYDGLPLAYAIHSDEATQMQCADGSYAHDMILTSVPGDPAYRPLVAFMHCFEGPDADMPYTSAADVTAAVTSGALVCHGPMGAVQLSPVVAGR